jgi:hypothetical protein
MVSVPINYLECPATVVNQALDMVGADEDAILGDLADGTRVGETARRNYGQTLRQVLRASHWPFARAQAQLTLLGDATGNSAAPVSTYVDSPWAFAYAWPTDAVQGRWLPWSPVSTTPTINGIPLTTQPSALINYPLLPGRFLVSSSSAYPIVVGTQPWTQLPDLQRTEGLGPVYRKIILSDCSCASFVYTRLVTVIEEWDDGFRNAMVTAMALVLAPVAISDQKMRLAEMNRLIPILKNTLDTARAQASNESGAPLTIDKEASYIAARNRGGWPFGGIGAGPGGVGYNFGGYYGYGWDSFSCGGAVF